jgi:hypothetical protein
MDGQPREPLELGDWAYVTLVSAVPGLSLGSRSALAAQFLLFEGLAVALAARYGRWEALLFGTIAIGVATIGSGFMLLLSDKVRALDPPARYRRALFHSSVDVVMGLVAFIGLLTYLLVNGRGTLLQRVLGDPVPAPAIFFALLVAWDLSYRIGTAWWASITGLWRAATFGRGLPDAVRRKYARVDLFTLAFAGLQLLLVPFLWSDRVLTWLVIGHVVAVAIVSSLAIGLQLRG